MRTRGRLTLDVDVRRDRRERDPARRGAPVSGSGRGRLPRPGLGVAAGPAPRPATGSSSRPVSSRRCRATSRSSTIGWSSAAWTVTIDLDGDAQTRPDRALAVPRSVPTGARAGDRRRHRPRRFLPAAHLGQALAGRPDHPAVARRGAFKTVGYSRAGLPDPNVRVPTRTTPRDRQLRVRRAVLRRGIRHPGGACHPDRASRAWTASSTRRHGPRAGGGAGGLPGDRRAG